MKSVTAPARENQPTAPDPRSRRGIGLGQPYGVPLRLHPSFLLLGVVVAVFMDPVLHRELPGRSDLAVHAVSALIALGLLASVALHECGHAVVARVLGMRVEGVHLWGLGGSTALAGDPPTPRAQYLVSIAGPLVNLLLGGLGAALWLGAAVGTIPYELGLRLAAVNALLAVYNLLPGLPLDGGQLVRAAVWSLTGDKITGLRAAGYGGFVAAAATAALAVAEASDSGDYGMFTMLVAVSIAMQAQQALRGATIARRLPTVIAGRLARPAYVATEDLPLAEALRRASAQGRSAVVFGPSDSPVGVLSETLLAQVPDGRRPWVPLSSVLCPARPLDAALAGEDLLQELRADGVREHVVMNGPRLVGVLQMTDVASALTHRAAARTSG
jgi:Zn-dependent protease